MTAPNPNDSKLPRKLCVFGLDPHALDLHWLVGNFDELVEVGFDVVYGVRGLRSLVHMSDDLQGVTAVVMRSLQWSNHPGAHSYVDRHRYGLDTDRVSDWRLYETLHFVSELNPEGCKLYEWETDERRIRDWGKPLAVFTEDFFSWSDFKHRPLTPELAARS